MFSGVKKILNIFERGIVAWNLITEVINSRETHDSVEVKLQDIANTVADISDEIEGIEV
jgi:hypothetical protein